MLLWTSTKEGPAVASTTRGRGTGGTAPMQSQPSDIAKALAPILLEKINIQLEREAFMDYVEAIGEKCRSGHAATAAEARETCPEEFAAWRAAFKRAYRTDPIASPASACPCGRNTMDGCPECSE